MKKALALLIILTILSGYGIYCANSTIGKEIDNVQWQENIIYGDKSIVEGVTIQRNTKYEDYLYWNTTYVIGEDPSIDTDFYFYELGKSEDWEYNYEGLNFLPDSYSLMEGTVWNENGTSAIQWNEAFQELVDEAPAGKTTTKQVYLKDYMDYYGFEIYVDIPELEYSRRIYHVGYEYTEEEIEKLESTEDDFNEFFKIPVLDTDVYQIGVNKNADGEVIGYGYNSHYSGMSVDDYSADDYLTYGDSFIFDMDSVYTQDRIYFVFSPLTNEGKLVDTSLIPGGYGIYSCKYDAEKDILDAQSLKMEYALEPTGYVSLEMDTNQENLLVFTEDANQFYLTIVDLDTMETKQQIAYGSVDVRDVTRWYHVEEDYLIAQYDYDEAMIFSKNANGTYTPEYTVPGMVTEVADETYFLVTDYAFDWDGEKLLVVGDMTVTVPYYHDSCGVFVAAFDETGLIYYAEYDSSLNTNIGTVGLDYWTCEPCDVNPLSANW